MTDISHDFNPPNIIQFYAMQYTDNRACISINHIFWGIQISIILLRKNGDKTVLSLQC